MKKTTVYLPAALKARLEAVAAARGCSEAELIRAAIAESLDRWGGPEPTPGLVDSGDPELAAKSEEHLAGFGQR